LELKVLVWSGRAQAKLNLDQAKSLDNSEAPLIDQQQNNPSEPLSETKSLHSPLETLKGQPTWILYQTSRIQQ